MLDLTNKTILVTGGTGSFGKSFIKSLLKTHDVRKIIVFSRDELKQYHMEKELSDPRLRFFIGDVRDELRLERAFTGVDIVVHAAALKQVPALEYNPFEAVKTNIIGSENVIEAAINQNVPKVLLISTDKAAYPANLYGSTKLCAEKLFIAANSYSGISQFSVVRYGNVLGSRGSIIETLLRERHTGRIKVTNLEMTRFWISLNQAFDLVMFALGEMLGGEIFIPKLPSMKLLNLLESIAPDVEREIIGIRPGEKMHEMLLTDQEARHSIEIDDYYVVLPEFPFWSAEGYRKYDMMGSKVKDGFAFESHTNTRWLSNDDLRNLIQKDNIV